MRIGFTSKRSFSRLKLEDGFKYDRIEQFLMATPADGWPVWIPLIVGLAPGLVYWIAITAMKKRR